MNVCHDLKVDLDLIANSDVLLKKKKNLKANY